MDLVDIARIERAIARRGEAFERRVYTDREVHACRRAAWPGRAFALCFAAKEAALKAVGSGWGQGVEFRDVELVERRLVLHGAAAARVPGARTHLALAGDRRRALAVVVLETP